MKEIIIRYLEKANDRELKIIFWFVRGLLGGLNNERNHTEIS